jgi:ribonuclease-3
MSGGRTRPSNLAGGLEALIGAAYLDGGLRVAQKLVLKLLKPDLDEIAAQGFSADSKSELQHLAQTRWHEIPRYALTSSEGPDHAKLFTVEVSVGDQILGRGQGRNKKQAELNAARQALETLAATG